MFQQRLYQAKAQGLYEGSGSLTAEYASSAEPVSRKDGRNLEYRRIGAGRVWSRENYGCAWFRFSGEIPECAKGKKVGLLLDVGAEGCIYDENGSPRSGLTGAHDFVEFEQPNAGKHFYELSLSQTEEKKSRFGQIAEITVFPVLRLPQQDSNGRILS